MFYTRLAAFTALAGLQLTRAQDLVSDSGRSGPELEVVHLYNDQWPTGIAVSSTGRKFSNYPGGLDPNNTNDGTNGKYTVAELFDDSTEKPYPSAEMNNPPGGAINSSTNPPTGANYQDYLLGVQSVVIDSADRLWILDTGRVLTPEGVLVQASVGGAKLIGVDLATDSIIKTIVFPNTVAYPVTYLNDVRFDLNPSLTSSGEGVAYITDSSSEGRTGLIVVDLGSGESWRHLDSSPYVQGDRQFLAFVWGHELYAAQTGKPGSFLTFGADGIALGADGKDLYFGGVGNRYMYSIPTERLLDNGPTSEIKAQAAVVTRSQKGLADGFETDSNGLIYHGNMEVNAVNYFSPENGTDQVFLRDPRINWADTVSDLPPLSYPPRRDENCLLILLTNQSSSRWPRMGTFISLTTNLPSALLSILGQTSGRDRLAFSGLSSRMAVPRSVGARDPTRVPGNTGVYRRSGRDN